MTPSDTTIQMLNAQLEEQQRLTSHYMEKHEAALEQLIEYKAIIDEQAKQIKGMHFEHARTVQQIINLKASLEEARRKRAEYALAAGVTKQDTERMVARIVEAIEADGFEIAGWGNDSQLTELEAVSLTISDQATELAAMLNTIRTGR